MEFKPGAKLGPYEILSAIGKGGMGEVWRARDTRLGRDVAIKISIQSFTDRFEREARAIAALNHPNICTLYDVGPDYLVMELVEGPTLADRIAEGPIPLDEALGIARQIADALEAAHEKNIVHRDLKPANVKVRDDGSVKVLDFGLAKSSEPVETTSDSPTILSAHGVILGTASYMAPEQARGRDVDKRADIFAFAVVLHEMATGERLFGGDDLSEMLAKVIRDEPDLSGAPPRIRRLLTECLHKDPRKRLRDIGDAWRLLDENRTGVVTPQAAPPRRSRWLWPAISAALLLAVGSLAFVHFRETPPLLDPVHFEVSLPPRTTLVDFRISPDGRKLAFNLLGREGRNSLWLHRMDSAEMRELPGTTGIVLDPAWSPDSQFIAFFAEGKLKKIDISGGTPQTLAPFETLGSGIAWSSRDVILYSSHGVIYRIPSGGGEPVQVTMAASNPGELAQGRPFFLPDQKHFLYYRYYGAQADASQRSVFVGSIDLKPADQAKERLMESRVGPVYIPSRGGRGGYLLFMRGDALLAQPFDPVRLALTGAVVQLADRVKATGVRGSYSVSATGTLTYAPMGGSARQLTWFDRQGKVVGLVGDPGARDELALSPDGTRIAEGRLDEHGQWDIWTLDLARGASTRLTFDTGGAGDGIWSPDGTQIVYAPGARHSMDLYRKPASGASQGELLFHSSELKLPLDWSRDGRFILLQQYAKGSDSNNDIWALPMQGDRKPFPFVATRFSEQQAQFSPDGRWVVYTSNESGIREVYVQPFPSSASGKWSLSNGGGNAPRWRRDGKELFYFAPDNTLMAVDVTAKGNAFQPGVPKPLFRADYYKGGSGGAAADGWRWDVSNDGQRFLINTALESESASPVTVLLNWESTLK